TRRTPPTIGGRVARGDCCKGGPWPAAPADRCDSQKTSPVWSPVECRPTRTCCRRESPCEMHRAPPPRDPLGNHFPPGERPSGREANASSAQRVERLPDLWPSLALPAIDRRVDRRAAADLRHHPRH